MVFQKLELFLFARPVDDVIVVATIRYRVEPGGFRRFYRTHQIQGKYDRYPPIWHEVWREEV
jgi:hypothetical protein